MVMPPVSTLATGAIFIDGSGLDVATPPMVDVKKSPANKITTTLAITRNTGVAGVVTSTDFFVSS